jgi:hypothetical protein
MDLQISFLNVPSENICKTVTLQLPLLSSGNSLDILNAKLYSQINAAPAFLRGKSPLYPLDEQKFSEFL